MTFLIYGKIKLMFQTTKQLFVVLKAMVLGYHHFRTVPFISVDFPYIYIYLFIFSHILYSSRITIATVDGKILQRVQTFHPKTYQ